MRSIILLADGCGVIRISHSILPDLADARAKSGEIGRVIGEPIIVAADRRQAVGVDDPPAIADVARAPVPAERAGRVAGRGDRGQVQVAEPDDASVADDLIHARGREGLVHPGLRIADARGARLEDLRGRLRGVELRAGQLLEPPDAADMVDMLMAVQQDLHVLGTEAECADVVEDRSAPVLGAARRSGCAPRLPVIRIEEMPHVPTR